ncbi:MAG TPA: GNAT family N-acetyltransferase [Hyphomicrobium sp.]|nr:GNAT family N-acetyltransferase [Hyphomicrobium sp.]
MDDIEIVSGCSAIAQLAPLWDEAAVHGGIGAFERFDLVRDAARAAADLGSEPMVIVFRRAGRVASLLALRTERLMGARVAVALVHPLAQYADTAGAALTPEELAQATTLLAARGLNMLLLRKVREDSSLHAALSANGHSQSASETALYIDLAAFGTLDAYEASFSSTTRRNRRQRRKKLEALAGPLSFAVLRGEEALAAFDKALDWKRAWLADRGIASPVFDSGAWEGLLRSMVASGEGIVSTLHAGDRLVAVELGFADEATYIAYLGAFEPEFSSASPGQEQMLRTVAWCFEQGLARYDLLAPADDYKRQWARKETGVAIDDYAVALTVLGRGVAGMRRRVRPVARTLYLRLSPEVRLAGERYGKPAAAVAAAAALCAGAVLEAMS